MSLEYTQPHDQSVAPSLVIDMANPRILVLFRQASSDSLFSVGWHSYCIPAGGVHCVCLVEKDVPSSL